MTTLGWLAAGAAALFGTALIRLLVMLGARFPLDPEVHTPQRPAPGPTQEQWPMQAHLETIIANSRRSRSDWNEGAKALLRPLAPGRTVDSFASLPIEFDLPRRYDHEWMEQVVASAEHEVGLDAHNTGRPETNR